MAVPSPSIKPMLVGGGVHRAIYLGAVGLTSSPTPADSATGVARFNDWYGSPPQYAEVENAKVVRADDPSFTFTIVGVDTVGDDVLFGLRADTPGAAGNIPAGTALVFGEGRDGVAVNDFYGGVDASSGGTTLHIDLTSFSEKVREQPFFVDQLVVLIDPLDDGITDVQPRVVQKQHFGGDRIPEYLTLNVVSDSDANEWAVWVISPHSHMR